MSNAPNLGILITGDASKLIEAAKNAQTAMGDFGKKTAGQMAKDADDASKAQIKSARNTQWQTFQLYQQIQDVGIQIAGGQNPLLALAQQGSQLTAIYGSTAGALRAVGGALSFLLNPISLMVAAVGAFGYAFFSADEKAANFRKTLLLTGNAAGMTSDTFSAMAASIAATTGTSKSKVSELGMALMNTGRFGAQGFSDFVRVAANMSTATGQSVDQTVQSLSQLKDSPASWAESMNKQLHFVSAAQLAYIQKLEAYGKREEAVAVVRDALLNKFPDSVEKNLSWWDKQVREHNRIWSNLAQSAMKFLGPQSLDDQIASAKDVVDRLKSDYQRITNRNQPKDLADAEEKLRMLQSKNTAQIQLAGETARVAALEQEQIEKDALEKKLRGARESLLLARLDLSIKKLNLDVEKQLLTLRANLADTSAPILQAYYEQKIAESELLKLTNDRKNILGQIAFNASKKTLSPEEDLAKQTQAIQLQGQLKEIELRINDRNVQLEQRLSDLRQKQILDEYKLIEAKEESGQSRADQVRDSMYRGNNLRDQLAMMKMSSVEAELFKGNNEVTKRESAVLAQFGVESKGYQDAQKMFLIERNALMDIYLYKLGQETKGLRDELALSKMTPLMADYSVKLNEINKREKQALENLQDKTQYDKVQLEFMNQRNALMDLHSDKLDREMNATRGVQEAVKNYRIETQAAGRAAYAATTTVINSIENTLTNMVVKGKLDVKSLIDTFISEFARLQIVKPFMDQLMNPGGGFESILATIFSGGGAPTPASSMPYIPSLSGGGYTGNGIRAGGLDGQGGFLAMMHPQEDVYDRVHGTGSAYVAASGGSNVVVNVHNNGGGEATVSQRNDGGQTTIDVMISAIESRIAANVSNGSGPVSKAMSNRFGLRTAVA